MLRLISTISPVISSTDVPEGITTCVVKIPEQIRFANYTYIAPDYDLDGKVINHTLDGVMHRIAITVSPETVRLEVELILPGYMIMTR